MAMVRWEKQNDNKSNTYFFFSILSINCCFLSPSAAEGEKIKSLQLNVLKIELNRAVKFHQGDSNNIVDVICRQTY